MAHDYILKVGDFGRLPLKDMEQGGGTRVAILIYRFSLIGKTSDSDSEVVGSSPASGAMRKGMMYRNHLLVPCGQDVGLEDHHSKSGS